MTYAWPGGLSYKEQCRGTTKAGKSCQRRGWNLLGYGFWCPAHGTIRGPHKEES